ncbi:MAG TPA: alpha/beta fold hydrolase [Polyangiaceae bacterium]|jgi:DNA-binding response OmpR family regulator|nr:alpha/beta fold hydrolase [Polyangiaceae bacterium]
MKVASPVIRFIECRSGERVAIATHGSGPLLVCPAWWVGHLELDWDEPRFRRFFTRLGEVATVVRYDRPGVGLSGPVARPRSLAQELAALEDVISAQQQHLGQSAQRVNLLGVSCGGPPAIAYASRHPDRTDQLILAGTFARGEDIGPPQLRDALLELVRVHWGAGSRALADAFLPDADAPQRDAVSRLQRTAADAATAADVLALTYAMDVSDLLSSVRARTTVLHRRGDRAIPYAAGHQLALGVPNANLVTLDGRDHPPWLHEGAGDLVAEVLTATEREPERGCRLEREGRCIWLDGQRVELTPLEYGTLARVVEQAGRVVSREELLETVWKQPYSGSNVVDAVVRTLRKKLGRFAPSIETVVGHGYRFETFRES